MDTTSTRRISFRRIAFALAALYLLTGVAVFAMDPEMIVGWFQGVTTAIWTFFTTIPSAIASLVTSLA